MITLNITHKIPSQFIADLMITVIEGGSSYWCDRINRKLPMQGDDLPWYSAREYYEQDDDNEILFTIETDDGDEYGVSRDSIRKGFELMATKYPEQFADLSISSKEYDEWDVNWDAATADVWFQLVTMGDVVYG